MAKFPVETIKAGFSLPTVMLDSGCLSALFEVLNSAEHAGHVSQIVPLRKAHRLRPLQCKISGKFRKVCSY